ncbi:hypothetical protein [Herbiconiux sp.]|uniref:hypothetical protein n=1 Tax=Herbiconiux sp. TaxID=1871186 RepID=UPI0025C3D269|nr:hypothetical protein [Herbiconiux sp.]
MDLAHASDAELERIIFDRGHSAHLIEEATNELQRRRDRSARARAEGAPLVPASEQALPPDGTSATERDPEKSEEPGVRPGATSGPVRKILRTGAFAAALVGVTIVGTIYVMGQQPSGETAPTPTSPSAMDPAAVDAYFTGPQRPGDQLATALPSIEPESTRRLDSSGSPAGGGFWLARSVTGQYCAILAGSASGAGYSWTCSVTAAFPEAGLRLANEDVQVTWTREFVTVEPPGTP